MAGSTMSATARLLALGGAAALLIAACGSGGAADDTAGDPSGDTAAASDQTAETGTDGSGTTGSTTPSTTARPSTSAATATSEPSTSDEPATTTEQPSIPFDLLGELANGAETSQLATSSSELPVLVVDRFEIEEPAEFGTLRWHGIYCEVVTDALEPAPTSSGFSIVVYGDRDGAPDLDTAVASYAYDIAEVEQTPLFTSVQPCGPVTSTWAYYDYRAALSPPFTPEPGTGYWLAIQALTPNFATFWGWRGAAGDDASSLQFFDGARTELVGDRAYAFEP